MAALDDPARLAAAAAACAAAHRSGVATDFPLAHLAEAYLRAGRFHEALEASRDIDRARFDALGLHWRNVRLDEIEAAALVRLGRIGEAELVIQRLRNELGNEGDDEFLPAPTELADALLDLMNSDDETLRMKPAISFDGLLRRSISLSGFRRRLR